MKKEQMYPVVEEWLSIKGSISKVDFCREHNVSYHSLGYWQGKYNKESNSFLASTPTDFLPVKINNSSPDPTSTASTPKAEIEFPSGLKLKIY